MGFTRSINDNCLFQRRENQASYTRVLIYVDDILISTKNKETATNIIEELNKVFTIVDMGEPRKFLNINIHRDYDNRTITLDNKGYIDNMCNELKSKIVKTPLPEKYKLKIDKEKPNCIKEIEELIGVLNYLAHNSRPDITFASSYLNSGTKYATQELLETTRNILYYLKATSNYKLTLGNVRPGAKGLEIYSDASHFNDHSQRARSGACILIDGALIDWISHQQSRKSTSSTESEIRAAIEATKRGMFIRNLLQEMDFGERYKKPCLYIDNATASGIFKSQCDPSDTLYLAEQFEFIKEYESSDELEVKHVKTEDMFADIMTKSLGVSKHWKFMRDVNMISDENENVKKIYINTAAQRQSNGPGS